MKNTNENKQMVLSQNKEIKHHTDELSKVLGKHKNIESWVVGKIERASTDLSDVTHYLDGKKYAKGGGVDDEEIDDFVYEYGVNRKEAEETLKRRKGRLSPKENLRLKELNRKNTNVGLTLTDSEEIEFDKLVHKYRGWDYKMSKGGKLGGFCYSIGGL
jgi:hypothetical protein